MAESQIYEYIITVENPKVWDDLWNELTVDGLGDNYIPKRSVGVANERPFNDYCAHFRLTIAEAKEIAKDPRVQSIELKADLQEDVKKEFLGLRTFNHDKGNTTTPDMKNWGLVRCTRPENPYATATSLVAGYPFNLDGKGVDIVVVDSGVEPDHPEFAVNPDGTGGSRVIDFDWSSLGVPGVASASSIGGYLGDADGHGSNCASIAAGNTCGWAAGADIYSIRIFDGNDIKTGTYKGAIDSDVAFDLVRAFHLKKIAEGNTRPTICTNSWGYRSSYSGIQYTVYRGVQYNNTSTSATYGQIYTYHPYTVNYLNVSVDNASAAGVVMVGAAGNYRHKIDVPGGLDYDNYYHYSGFYGEEDVYYHKGSSPTNASSMICVGAVDNTLTEQKATFSETGPRVDVYAPGVMIMGAYANSSYQTPPVVDPRSTSQPFYLNKISGTSQATPQVTGVLACILQARPSMTPAEAKAFLKDRAIDNQLVVSGVESYSNTRSLQGGQNKLLFMPFNSPIRGKISS